MPTYDELQDQIRRLQEQAEAVRQSELESVLAQVKAQILKYGLTEEQLGFSSFSRRIGRRYGGNRSAPVAYRKGALTWSGASRGRKPKWVAEALAAGEDLEQYRVK